MQLRAGYITIIVPILKRIRQKMYLYYNLSIFSNDEVFRKSSQISIYSFILLKTNEINLAISTHL